MRPTDKDALRLTVMCLEYKALYKDAVRPTDKASQKPTDKDAEHLTDKDASHPTDKALLNVETLVSSSAD